MRRLALAAIALLAATPHAARAYFFVYGGAFPFYAPFYRPPVVYAVPPPYYYPPPAYYPPPYYPSPYGYPPPYAAPPAYRTPSALPYSPRPPIRRPVRPASAKPPPPPATPAPPHDFYPSGQ